jgi:phage terminase Nu1 subunit (DNA packaging protein)
MAAELVGPLTRDEANIDEIAGLLDVTTRRVSMLVKDGYIPKASHNRYPVAACIKGYIRYLREVATDSGDESLSKQRARLTRSKADMAEMERSRLLGDSLPRNEVVAAGTAVMKTVSTRMLAIAPKYASRLTMIRHASEVEAILRPAIEEGLEELSRLEVLAAPVRTSGRGRVSDDVARRTASAAKADRLGVE